MEEKILLFDVNDVKVGETFGRRARQMVVQQRAVWTDESKRAIRFTTEEAAEASGAPEPDEKEKTADALYALAEKRLRVRKRFVIHSIALLPGYIICLFCIGGLSESVDGGFAAFLCGILFGIWTTLYVGHAYFYKKTHGASEDKKERYRRKLEDEVVRLKRMGDRYDFS